MFNQNEFVYGFAISSSSLLFAMAVLAGFLLLAILVSLMRIYKKAGKPSISAIVPIWSQVVLFQIVDKPWWYLFLLLIPIANIVILIQAYILLAKKFGKGVGFAIAMCFLPMIFIPLLSFYDYIDENSTNGNEVSEPVYNPFNQTEVSQVMPTAPQTEQSNTLVQSEEKKDSNTVDIPVQENINLINQDNVVNINNNDVIIPEVPIESIQESNVLSEESSVDAPVIPEVMPKDNSNIDVVSDEKAITNTETKEIIVGDSKIQDIQTVLNTNNLEPKNVAFNSTPIIPNTVLEQVETLDTLSENKVLETTVIEKEEENREDIEMPEIAAKTCPACGISLAEDIKFCTSCGTQL